MATTYKVPIPRNFNPLFGYTNPQQAALTGRDAGGFLPASTSRRAVMQGVLPTLSGGSGTSGTEALSAIGMPEADEVAGLGAVVDSPESADLGGGSGPSGMNAASLGLGSSQSGISSSQGAGVNADAGVGGNSKTGQATVDALGQVGRKVGTKAAVGAGMSLAAGSSVMDALKLGAMSVINPLGIGISLATTLGGAALDAWGQSKAEKATEDATSKIAAGTYGPEDVDAYMSGMKTAQNIQNPWSSYVTGPISRAIGMKSDALGLQDSQSPSYDVGLVEPGLRGPGMTPQDMLSRMGVTMSDVLGLTNPQETEVENLEPITAIGQPDSSTARTSLDTLNDALGLSGVNSLAGTQARDAYNRSGSATSPSDNVGGSYGANDPSNPSTSNEGPLGGPSLGGWGGFGSTDRDRGGSSSGGYGGNSRGGSDGTGR